MATPGRVTPDPIERDDEDESWSLDDRLTETRVEPAAADVVLSKGWVRHPGNMNFHRGAKQMAEAYGLSTPCGKVFVTQLLVHTLAEQNSRFLVRRTELGSGWRKASTTESFKAAAHALHILSLSAGNRSNLTHRLDQRRRHSTSKPSKCPGRNLRTNQTAQANAMTHRQNPNKTISQTTSQAETSTFARPHDTDTSRIPDFTQRRFCSSSTMESLEEVTRALQSHAASSSLSSLHVEVGETASVQDVQAFAQALVQYSQLCPDQIQSLHVKLSPQLHQDNAKQLALGIRRCRGLQTLKVQFHGARRKFALLLVPAAIGNSTVTSLLLDGNRLGDRGALWIFCILQSCPRSNLQYVSLENNAISAAGATAVRRLLGPRGRTIRTVMGDGDGVRHSSGCFNVISRNDENENL